MRYTEAGEVGAVLTSAKIRYTSGDALPSLLRACDAMWGDLQALALACVFVAPRGRRLRAIPGMLEAAEEFWGLGKADYLSGYASPSERGFVVLYFREFPGLGDVLLRAVFCPKASQSLVLRPMRWRFQFFPSGQCEAPEPHSYRVAD